MGRDYVLAVLRQPAAARLSTVCALALHVADEALTGFPNLLTAADLRIRTALPRLRLPAPAVVEDAGPAG
jgi:hypothetical protein